VQHGVLDQAKLDAIQTDAPKGMVQIARYFGSEFLRPELEKAKDRIVNMVSLTLEIQSGGDLRQAAEQLREHSFMSRSKAASDMLKALIVMPQNTHFGMNEHGGFSDKHIPQLAKWSLCNLAEYQAELAKRQQVAHVIDAAIWLADDLGLQRRRFGRSRLRCRSRDSYGPLVWRYQKQRNARLGGVSKNHRHAA